jgi:hypothetical protein
MGDEYNQPWERCESRKNERRGKFLWEKSGVFTRIILDNMSVMSVES